MARRPAPKEVDYEIIPDQNTILTLLESHAIDFENDAPDAQARQSHQLSGYHVFLTPFTRYLEVEFNLSHPPLNDVRVRQALAYATNRQLLIKNVAHGVEILADGDQPPFLWAANPNVRSYAFNPVKAGELLGAAGWAMSSDGFRHKGGQTLSLTLDGVVGNSVERQIQAVLQSEWGAVGVRVYVKEYGAARYFATYGEGGTLETGNFDAALHSWNNGIDPDDSTLFMCNQVPPHGQNSYRFCDRELDAEEAVAVGQYDVAKRKIAYGRIQEILAQQEPMIVLWFVRRMDVANSDLRNYKPAHAVTTFWNTWEWEI